MSGFNDIMIIFCLVLGEAPKRRFPIDISRSGTTTVRDQPIKFEQLSFGHIQKLVHAEIKYNSRASDLELWKTSISTKPEDKGDKLEILRAYAQNAVHVEIDIEKQLGGAPLKSDDYVKDIFNEDPPDKNIHIIIKKSGKVLVCYK